MEEGSNGDGDESGGTSPSRQGADTGILSPRNLFSTAAEIGIASGEKGSCSEGFRTRGKYRRRGASRGPTGQPGGPLAWSMVGPRQAPSWVPGGGPPSLLWLLRKLPGR